ncbi:unnamed protein product [Polarella glacialis]|uniref:Uncharacterized protein n=1 Tax=Polarella glacialis TaxID=89957 RepID=A0A813GI88_POLGL|nr:unnamed protein product [Polarella glacialis]
MAVHKLCEIKCCKYQWEKKGHRDFPTSNRAKVSSAEIHKQQETTNKTTTTTQHRQQEQAPQPHQQQQKQRRTRQKTPRHTKPEAVRLVQPITDEVRQCFRAVSCAPQPKEMAMTTRQQQKQPTAQQHQHNNNNNNHTTTATTPAAENNSHSQKAAATKKQQQRINVRCTQVLLSIREN